jgi:branched-chain amino acid transport system substrate-binding protein
MNKKVAFIPMVVLLLAIGILGCSDEKGVITIGAVAPLTGKYAEMGNDLINAVKMAVEDKNANGGIDGKKIVLVVEDDEASPEQAVAVAHKLAANQAVIGIVGHMNSGTTLPASSVYHQAGMAVVMPVPTNPQITQQGFNNLFRVPITDDKQGPADLEFILNVLKKEKIAIIHNKDTYGEGIATEVKKALEAHGKQPLIFQGVSSSDQDFRPILTKVKSLSPEVVFFGGGYAEAALMIKQSRELSLNVPFVMGDGCFDSQLMKIAGQAAEGSFISNIAPISAPTAKAKDFYDRFEAKYGKIVAFAPLGYESTNILLDAIEKSESKTRSGVLKILQDANFAYDGILGTFSFTKNGDSKGRQIFIHTIKNGGFVPYGQ